MRYYDTVRRIIKILSYLLVFLFVVFSVSVALFTLSGPERRARLVEHVLEAATGGRVGVDRVVSLSLGSRLTVHLEGVRIGQARRGPLAAYAADEVEVDFPLLPLLAGGRLELSLRQRGGRVKPAPGVSGGLRVVPVRVVLDDVRLGPLGAHPVEVRRLRFVHDRRALTLGLDARWGTLPLRIDGREGAAAPDGRRSWALEGRAGSLVLEGRGWQRPGKGADRAAFRLELTLHGSLPGVRGPVKGRLVVEGAEGAWVIEAMRLEGPGPVRLAARGRVADPVSGRGLELEWHLEGPTKALLPAVAGPVSAPSGDWRLEGRLTGPWKALAAPEIRLDAGFGSGRLEASGSARGLLRPEELMLTLSGRGRLGEVPVRMGLSLEAEGARTGLRFELAEEGHAGQRRLHPLRLRSTLTRQPGRLTFSGLRLELGDNRLDGVLTLAVRPGGAPRLSGTLRAGRWDWRTLLRPAAAWRIHLAEGRTETVPGTGGRAERRLFDDRPLALEWLSALEGELELRAEEMRGRLYRLTDVEARLAMEAGRVRLDPFRARLGGRPLTLAALLDGRVDPPRMALRLDVEEADLAEGFPGAGLPAGRLSLHLDLEGRGRSRAEVAATLEGEAVLHLEDLLLGSAFVQDSGRALLRRLEPSGAGEKDLRVECAALHLQVKDGVARTPRGLVIRLPSVIWIGNGVVDLGRETLFVQLRPRARSGPGLPLKGLADLVAVGGTLLEPYVVLDPEGAVLASLSYAAAVYTGGVSLLLEGAWERLRRQDDACARVLEGSPEAGTTRVPEAAAPDAQEALDAMESH